MNGENTGRFRPFPHQLRRLREAAYRRGVTLPSLDRFSRCQVALAIFLLEKHRP